MAQNRSTGNNRVFWPGKDITIIDKCPSQDVLKNWASGQLPEDQADEVTDHLGQCEACDTVVAQSGTHTFVNSEKSSRGFFNEPECQQLNELLELDVPPGQQTDSAVRANIAELRIRDYEIMNVLGEGGMGIVYRARHVRLQKDVALKLLSDNATSTPQSIARFEREMQVIGRLDHPNVVRAFDAGDFQGRPFLAMELIEGIELSEIVASDASLDVADACELARQAAIGLQYAHDEGLIHRDIKPANLMLSLDPLGVPNVKVLDLGLARVMEGALDELTDQGQLMGTLKYMAPEQAGDGRQIDHRADIYALGATLYRLLTGVVPFSGEQYSNSAKRLRGLLQDSAPSIALRRPSLPAKLVQLVDCMLTSEPSRRIQSMQSAANELAPFATGHDLSALFEQSTTSLLNGSDTVVGDNALRDTSPTVSTQVNVVSTPAALMRRSRPWKRISVWLSTIVFAAVLFGVIWLKTDGGYLHIDAEPGIELSVKVLQDGEVVKSLRVGLEDNEFWFKSGQYEIRLPTDAEDKFTIEGPRVTLTRNGTEAVTIRRVKGASESSTDALSDKHDQPNPAGDVSDGMPRFSTYAQIVAADGATTHLRFSETTGNVTTDSIPLGDLNNAVHEGGDIQSVKGPTDCLGTAAKLDGSNFFRVRLNFTKSFTVEMWARSATEYWDEFGWLVSSRALPDSFFLIHPQPESKGWIGEIGEEFVGSHDIGDIREWHHYALSFDNETKLARMYTDGQVVAEKQLPEVTLTDQKIEVWLGRDQLDDRDRYGKGAIDEFAFYNSALSPEQMKRHFEAALATTEIEYRPNLSEILSAPLQHISQLKPYDVLTSEDWEWTDPVPLSESLNSGIRQMGCLSGDGLTMILGREPLTDRRGQNLWISRRESLKSPWAAPRAIASMNSNEPDFGPFLTSNGLRLVWHSDRSPNLGCSDLWLSERDTVEEPFGSPKPFPAGVNSEANEMFGTISNDGLNLLFVRNSKIRNVVRVFETRRKDLDSKWETPQPVPFSADNWDTSPCLSSDSLVLIFRSDREGSIEGSSDLWMVTRSSRDAPWSDPVHLGSKINDAQRQSGPSLSTDGTMLLFATKSTTDRAYELRISTLRRRDSTAEAQPAAPSTSDIGTTAGGNTTSDGDAISTVWPSGPPNFDLLTRRAEAFGKLGQWDRAIADWVQASRLQPDAAFQRFKLPESEPWDLTRTDGTDEQIEIVDGVIEFGISAETDHPRQVRITQSGLAVENGETYLLHFKMKSANGCRAFVTGRGLDRSGKKLKALELTDEYQEFNITFVASNSDDELGSILFALAQAAPGRAFLKDVVFMRVPSEFTTPAAELDTQIEIDASQVTDPQLCFSIADVYARDQQWKQGIVFYNKLITPQTTDVVLLARRAKAFEKLQQWDDAAADWARASWQETDITFRRFKGPDDQAWVLSSVAEKTGFLTIVDGTLEFGKKSATRFPYNVRLNQRRLRFENGATYMLRFKMKSPAGCQVAVKVQLPGKGKKKSWLDEPISPPAEFRDYEFTFVAQDVAAEGNLVVFDTGRAPGKIVLKDVVFMKIAEGNVAGPESPSRVANNGSIPTARDAVDRVLSKGGVAVVAVNGERLRVEDASMIPTAAFEFRGVSEMRRGAQTSKINDEDCKFLAKLQTVDQLDFPKTAVTETGLREFANSEQVFALWIPKELPRSANIPGLFPNLRHLSTAFLNLEKVTHSIRDNPSIVSLHVYRGRLSAQAWSNVASMPGLKCLNAQSANLKGEAIKQLSKSAMLQHLTITLHSDMAVSDLAPLANISTLKSIRVTGPDAKDIPPSLATDVSKLLPQCEIIIGNFANIKIRDRLIGYSPGPLSAIIE